MSHFFQTGLLKNQHINSTVSEENISLLLHFKTERKILVSIVIKLVSENSTIPS